VGYFEDGNDESYGSYIVAWIPGGAVPLAQAGIDVNPEECISWLENTDVTLRAVFWAIQADLAGEQTIAD
jgi:hypothetical protein